MRRSVLLAVGLFTGLACAAATHPPASGSGPTAATGPRARELFPLAIGNRWSYDVAFLGARQSLSVSIVTAEGSTFQDSRGLKFILDGDGLRDEHRYLLKDPIAVGNKWQSIIDVSTTESYEVTEVGTSVDVPAGHFDGCVRVQSRNPQGQDSVLIAEQIYCPGVGLARVRTFQEKQGARGPVQWTQQLASFHVAPQP